MQQAEVIPELKRYFVQEVLGGDAPTFDETTPLLEWGILNSLEIVRLLTFIEDTFAVDISIDTLMAENLANVTSIANLIVKSDHYD